MKPLVFLPGTLCDARLWQHQIAALSGRAACHVAHYGEAQSIAGMARHVLLNAPPAFILAGLSIGGIVALEIWRQAPSRVHGLVLADMNPHADTPERKAAREQQLQFAARGALGELMEEKLIPAYLAKARQNDPGIRRCIAEMALALGADAFIRNAHALASRIDSVPTLSGITVPTLVMCGEEDRICPPVWHEEMTRHLPQGELVIIPNTGHLSAMESPEAVTAALTGFIQRISG